MRHLKPGIPPSRRGHSLSSILALLRLDTFDNADSGLRGNDVCIGSIHFETLGSLRQKDNNARRRFAGSMKVERVQVKRRQD